MTNHYGGPLKVSDKLYIMMWGRNEAAIKLISNLREVRKTQEKEKYKRYKQIKREKRDVVILAISSFYG